MHQSIRPFSRSPFLKVLVTSLLALSVCACGPSPTTSIAIPSSYPEASATSAPANNLAGLLTGQIVDSQEQQLRDNLRRQIVLDFPIRAGVVYYQLNSRLDKVDQEAVFDMARTAFKDSNVVKDTVLIPPSFAGQAQNFEGLRTLGSRFQTDVLIIITGQHNFQRSRQQQVGFFESFTDNTAYESQVTLEAIALDVFTGTLLKPFEVSAKGDRILLNTDAPDFVDASYAYQKEVEEQAWKALREEVVEGLLQLEKDVTERQEGPFLAPSPEPSVIPSGVPTAAPLAE